MRRTYRSKKDTDGVLEHRELMLNLDAKSSAFDAFYIQNIKQTKRELSCMGSSNAHGVAANRVRKKKYVKRIVKEVETVKKSFRDSLSQSAYLTPDKSIRVNKPLDPFDMLLNSSPVGSLVEPVVRKEQSVRQNVRLFEKPKREERKYTRKRAPKAKKFNYSTSESSDSDKENSDDKIDMTHNTTDIKAHQLLIEPETKTTPKHVNDSINNIVNNLSLMNKLKNNSHDYNESFNSAKFTKHRLTRNIPSPILQKSPLCSTPFKIKYRGESIFKFSPIISDNNPHIVTITEDIDTSNNSLVSEDNKPNILENTGSTNKNSSGNNVSNEEYENLDKIKDVTQCDKTKTENVSNVTRNVENSPKLFSDGSEAKTIPSIEISSFQTTEVEPFLGFSSSDKDDDNIKVINYSLHDDSVDKNDVTEIEVDNNLPGNTTNANDTKVSQSSSENLNEKDSLYDTCTSEQNSKQETSLVKEPVVKIQRLNDSTFMRYYKVMPSKKSAGNLTDDTTSSDNDSRSLDVDISTNENFTSFTGSEHSSDEKLKEAVVNITKMDESVLKSYLEKENNSNYGDTSDSDTSLEKSDNINLENDDCETISEGEVTKYLIASNIKNCSNDEYLDINDSENISSDDGSENDSIQEYVDNESSELYSQNDDSESNSNSTSEDKCISFVTTRRRNVSNNSFMSVYNDSFASSSTDCDKTVVSHKRKTDIISDDNVILESNEYEDATVKDSNINVINSGSESEEANQELEDTIMNKEMDQSRILFVSDRFSNVTDRKSSIRNRRSSLKPRKSILEDRDSMKAVDMASTSLEKPAIVLQPGKKWERSLSIYRRMTMMNDHFDHSVLEDEPSATKGRKYRQSVISTMEMQDCSSLYNESINSRRSTFVSKPSRSTIRFVKDSNTSRVSLSNTTVFDDLKGFLNEECDDTIIELSKLSIADQTHEVTVLDNFHDTSNRLATARDYVLRRCNQTDAIQFDECYPDSTLKNCHKIGEGVYGEVFLWRARDGRARVLKVVPIAGTLKVNGESQKDFHEIISEIVIAMELSALRAPIAEIERHADEGKDIETLDLHAIENATDVFNEVLAVRCVYGSYPSRLLDLWDLYDECKGSENDNPAILPPDQQYIVLELANAGQDLESYQFNNAEQAHALFLQVAYGLAVAEEAFQFEHRDLHWGNVLIAPTEQKYATFVLRGRCCRVARCGVAGTVIDYSLSRVALALGAASAELYNDLASDESLFDAVGDYQFQVYRLMRDKLGNDWKNFEPYTNILWLHYTVDKMITALRYKRTNTKIHKHYIDKLKGIKNRILDYGSAALFVLTDNEI